MPSSPPSDARLSLIAESYQRMTGKPLLPIISPLPFAGEGPGERAMSREAMWNAPFAIVAHGTEDDPVFFYGNRYALRHFGMEFDEFVRMPSRLSAEPLAQEAREKVLAKVAQQGYVDAYSGLRVAKSGRRFRITDCTIWNLLDVEGAYHGQAAVFVAQD